MTRSAQRVASVAMRWPHILILAATALALSSCGESGGSNKRKLVRKPPAPPHVAATLALPGEDGRVHVVVIEGGLETSQCLVHVGPTGSSTACTPLSDFRRQFEQPEEPR